MPNNFNCTFFTIFQHTHFVLENAFCLRKFDENNYIESNHDAGMKENTCTEQRFDITPTSMIYDERIIGKVHLLEGGKQTSA